MATMAEATRPAAGLTTEAGEEDDPGHVEVPLTAYVPVQVSPCVDATTDIRQVPLVMAAVLPSWKVKAVPLKTPELGTVPVAE